MDCFLAKKGNVMPVIDETLVGFKIEMLFQYDNDDGTTYLNWCNSVISSIINSKSEYVNLKWNH